MNKDVIAVAVGYNFGLIPSGALRDIALTPMESAVYIDEAAWHLFKAATFDDSRKVDDLLDKYGEHSIRDYKIEPVIMSGELELVIPGFDKERDSLLFGGYLFRCDGKDIPLDFSGISWSIDQTGDKLTVPFETGKTPLSTYYFLDDSYTEEYSAMGLRVQDITASFLSQASAISEFMVSLELNGKEYGPEDIARLGGFSLKSLCFSNQKSEYAVSQSVLDAFNIHISQEKETGPITNTLPSGNTTWITVYKDVLGYPSDHDNLTELCVPTAWLLDTIKSEGRTTSEWFAEYTADDTEGIAQKALSDGIILDCSDPAIKNKLLPQSSVLEQMIRDAQARTPGSTAKDHAAEKDIRKDPPTRD